MLKIWQVVLVVEENLFHLSPDELLEITPRSLRLRKRHLKKVERRRFERHQEDEGE